MERLLRVFLNLGNIARDYLMEVKIGGCHLVGISIPAWLNTFAEERRISYSKVLRDSLTEMYVRENQAAYSVGSEGG
jgi:hypothetical protein